MYLRVRATVGLMSINVVPIQMTTFGDYMKVVVLCIVHVLCHGENSSEMWPKGERSPMINPTVIDVVSHL